MIKAYYVFQNASKNVIRTSGMTLSCILILLLAFLSYFFWNMHLFISHWYTYTVNEAASMGSIGIANLISPSGMFLTFFKFISLLIAILFLSIPSVGFADYFFS